MQGAYPGPASNCQRKPVKVLRISMNGGSLAGHVGPEGRERADHLGKHLGIGRDDLPAVEVVVVARQVADEAAGLEHQQAAGGDVPRVQPDFPEAVVETRGDIGEIEGRLLVGRMPWPRAVPSENIPLSRST